LLHADDLDLCFDFFYERVRKDYFLRWHVLKII
jgi:hypothetical protein